MRIRNNLANTRGFAFAYTRAVRFRDMINEKTLHRAKVLEFFEKHGETATKDAFGVSRATVYRWQKVLRDGRGKLEHLTPHSTAPKRRRKRVIPDTVRDLILRERTFDPQLGKDKLAVLI